MDLVSLNTVRARLQDDGQTLSSTPNTTLSQLITHYSAEVEIHLTGVIDGLKKIERTEYYDFTVGQRLWRLRAWPVDTVATFKMWIDQDRDWLVASELGSKDFVVTGRLGVVELDPTYITSLLILPGATAPQAVKIQYTAGFGANTAAIESGYPSLSYAVADQVIYHWRRRASLGSSAISAGQGGSTTYQGPIRWLPDLEASVKMFTRSAIG